jgi:hypothetical protein
MDRADEVIYSVGLPGVPRVILWVKFSLKDGVLHPRISIKIFEAVPKLAFYKLGRRQPPPATGPVTFTLGKPFSRTHTVFTGVQGTRSIFRAHPRVRPRSRPTPTTGAPPP